MHQHDQRLRFSAWGLTFLVCALALTTWLQHTTLAQISAYDIFPLLGLLAFSLMWTHYILGALERRWQASPNALRSHFTITSGIVLGLLLAHPGLLEWQLWRDGLGLPPGSVLGLYADVAGQGAIILGSIALMIFLAFEAKRLWGDKSWWKYIEYLNIAAMFAILYHAYVIGGEISGWYKVVWIMYAVLLAAAIIYSEVNKRRTV